MSFLKKYQTHIVLFCLMVFGFWLRFRLACAEDLATDEIATLVTASQSFPEGIIKALVTKNFHAPLYYFLLHFWILLFGDSAISLRMVPVIFGTLCIPAAYACGKELFSKFAGFSAAILVTINSFMISYSHFGKFYALLELLGFLSVYLIIKISKDPQKKYFAWLSAVNACIIYTYVIGFVFVGMQFLVFAGYDFIRRKDNLRHWLRYACWMILLTMPIIPMMWMVIKNTQNPILVKGFWWYEYESEHIINVLMTWFSPAVPFIFANTEAVKVLPEIKWSLILNVLPTALSGIIIYITARKRENIILRLLLLTAFGFIFCEWIAALSGRFAFMPRYTLLAFPVIILSAGAGIALFKKSVFSYSVLSVFFVLNIGYFLIFSNISRPNNGILPLAELLTTLQFHKGDKIILPMRGYLINYFYNPKDIDLISFDLNYVFKTGDPQILSKMYGAQDVDEEKATAQQKFKRYLNSKEPTEAISNYFTQSILKDFNPDSRIVLANNCQRNFFAITDKNGNINNRAFFNAFCSKLTLDINSVLKQNSFRMVSNRYYPFGNILVYKLEKKSL